MSLLIFGSAPERRSRGPILLSHEEKGTCLSTSLSLAGTTWDSHKRASLSLCLSAPFSASCHVPRLGTSHSGVGLRKGHKTSVARPSVRVRPSVRKCPRGTFYAIWESRWPFVRRGNQEPHTPLHSLADMRAHLLCYRINT